MIEASTMEYGGKKMANFTITNGKKELSLTVDNGSMGAQAAICLLYTSPSPRD